MATTTLKLDWDDEQIRDVNRALVKLRNDTTSPARKARITKMLDDIGLYRAAVEDVKVSLAPTPVGADGSV